MGTYDNQFGSALHDPMFDREDVWEVRVGKHTVAWTLEDDVYIEKPEGFVLLGVLQWEDTDNPNSDDRDHNEIRLLKFVIDKLMEGCGGNNG